MEGPPLDRQNALCNGSIDSKFYFQTDLFLSRSATSGQSVENCDGRLVSCMINPCSTASCPAFTTAECIPNYCNKCSANFYIRGQKVSQQDCTGSTNPNGQSVKRVSSAVDGKGKTLINVIRKVAQKPPADRTAIPSPTPDFLLELRQFLNMLYRRLG
ncbi:hypothetical protein ElyMa_005010300 [Elysia marginata]|uniref:Uncharacterized protein n=1 Tax=Elysia marginata TaxID=1093978 RepID=A0AAV4JAA2_9GAST|nr:hypothetical protein ElyMa_005010300 [Elysia marginata]